MPGSIVEGAREVFVAGYEDLRRAALRRAVASGRGVGLALFVRSGMAAWMEACAALPRPPAATSVRPTAQAPLVPDDFRVEVAMLLAGMALSVHAQGGMTT